MKLRLLVVLLILSVSCDALTLSSEGKTKYVVAVPHQASPAVAEAAGILSKYLSQITGATFPVTIGDRSAGRFEIRVGFTTDQPRSMTLLACPDEYRIESDEENLFLTGGPGKGIIYAAYTFLEKYCDCRKYTAGAAFVPKKSTLIIPNHIELTETPAIDVRDYHYAATVDNEYMDWHKLTRHFGDSSSSQWGSWVHTFDALVPAEKYYATHPEYYAWYGGKRQPAQLCLSNPEVLDLLIRNLRLEMNKKPQARYWSVSQNDNYGCCQCEVCSAIDSAEDSHSGSVIRFVNKVASEFPDKIISTLAYQYSRSAPKITKPASNVNIMFCSIECDRSRPISLDTSAGSFAKDFEDWSRLTKNILIWDYVVQFSNYISPFPNLKVLQPNIRFFHANGVRDVFEQGSSVNWSDFGELKAYLIAAWLWNPSADKDFLYRDFMNGFYGPAGEPIGEYIRLIEKNMDSSRVMLDIYGNPVTPVRTWLQPEQVDRYQSLMEQAATLVKSDPVLSFRVQRASLPLRYVLLEQAKYFGTGDRGVFALDASGKWMVKPELRASVSGFVTSLKEQGITSLNENHYSPDTYFADWQRIFAHGMIEHLAMEKIVSFEIPFSPKYPAKGSSTLTDGIGGYDDYHYNWLGWEGTDMIALVDLGKAQKIDSISCDFMEDQKSWIFMPESVAYFISDDASTFRMVGNPVSGNEPRPNKNFNTKSFVITLTSPVTARYVKVVARNRKTCPQWHIGAGYNSWIFCDEIVVR